MKNREIMPQERRETPHNMDLFILKTTIVIKFTSWDKYILTTRIVRLWLQLTLERFSY